MEHEHETKGPSEQLELFPETGISGRWLDYRLIRCDLRDLCSFTGFRLAAGDGDEPFVLVFGGSK